MPSSTLNISIIQPDIVWEDKKANLQQYEGMIAGIEEKREIVVLPEMFSTGFSMSPETLAEPMDGATVQWMKDIARKYKCILTGSLIIEEQGNY
ncbi:MAG: nitrilase-related carbon-nitrogen hydrolase, partial [Flavipsychrobacter sp.]